MARIEIDRLHKAFDDFVAVQNSNFSVEDGEFFCLLGPSGCGKTTTLRMIAGLELPTSGRILLDGEDVTFNRAAERDIAFVFQFFALYPHMTVRKNIAFPLLSQGVARRERAARVAEAARTLRIESLLDRSVSGLSSGDRQRVALGRAIVREPKAFLMDEPLGALDSELRHVMTGELRALHDRIGRATIYVTHDQLEAMSMADRIAVMNRGLVEQIGSPREIYERPASMFVADFIGSPPMSLLSFVGRLEAGATEIRLGRSNIQVPAVRESLPECELALGVRPEAVRFDDASALRGAVFGTEYLGTTQIVTMTTEFGVLKARVGADLDVRIGERVGLAFRSERLSLFEKSSGRAIYSELHEGAVHG
jgi:multiple sugar transport system ATP-binding protein